MIVVLHSYNYWSYCFLEVSVFKAYCSCTEEAEAV